MRHVADSVPPYPYRRKNPRKWLTKVGKLLRAAPDRAAWYDVLKSVCAALRAQRETGIPPDEFEARATRFEVKTAKCGARVGSDGLLQKRAAERRSFDYIDDTEDVFDAIREIERRFGGRLVESQRVEVLPRLVGSLTLWPIGDISLDRARVEPPLRPSLNA